MSDLSRSIHTAAMSLSGLLILGATLFAERQSLRNDLLAVERDYITYLLLTMPASAASPADGQPFYDGPTDQLDDAWSVYEESSSEGEIAGLGALSLELPWKLKRMATTPDARLYYSTDTLSDPEQAAVNDLTRTYPTCSEGPVDSAYFLVIDVKDSPPNRLVGAPPRLLFTNQSLAYQPAHQWYCWERGPLEARFLAANSTVSTRGRTREQLRDDLLSRARKWGDPEDNADAAYRNLRSRFGAIEGESPRIELPFVAVSIPVRWATTALAAAGLALITWLSQLTWQASRSADTPVESLWLGSSSLHRSRSRGVDRLLAVLELSALAAAWCLLLLTPVAAAVVALADTWSSGHLALSVLLVLILLTSLALSIGTFRALARTFEKQRSALSRSGGGPVEEEA